MLSFTTILLIIFIIIGAYVIFTNRVEGRPKIIIIIAVIICLIFIIMNMSVFKKSTSSPIDASIITYIPPIDETIPLIGTPVPLIDTTSPTFSLSTWINITDWNPGTTKTVFSMTNNISDYTPKILLGNHKNELIITYYTTPTPVQNTNWLAKTNLNNIKNTKENNVKIALDEYINAKKEYIEASNSNINNDVESIINNTQNKLNALIDARKKYDGGTTGLKNTNAQTIYTPSSRLLKMEATLNSQTPSDYEVTLATVTENPKEYNEAILLQPRHIYYTDSSLYEYNIALNNYDSTDIQQHPQVKWITGELTEDYSLETIVIPQIRIQKWINIVITFGENSVDTYLDGKLVDTHISTGNIQYVTNVSNNTRLNWGGFIGYISSYNYQPNVLTPQEVLAIYKKGF